MMLLENLKSNKLPTFPEFFGEYCDLSVEESKELIIEMASEETHCGDCTRSGCTCGLCQLEDMLKAYRSVYLKQYFAKNNWEMGATIG